MTPPPETDQVVTAARGIAAMVPETVEITADPAQRPRLGQQRQSA